MMVPAKTREILDELTFLELREIAKKEGNEEAYLKLQGSADYEELSIFLGLEREFTKYLGSFEEISGKDSQRFAENVIQYRKFLLWKICFPTT